MFSIKRFFGGKTEESRTELARKRFEEAQAEFFRGVEAEMRRRSEHGPAPLMEGDAADRRIAAMTIAFDADGNRATDTASGMSVAFVRDDYPLERGEFWTLAWKAEEYKFRVSWADGFTIISRERGDLNFDEAVKLANELNLMEYSVPMVDTANPHEFLENIDVFVNLFAAVARSRLTLRNIDTRFEPWGVDPTFHRRLKLSPSNVQFA